MNNKRHGLKAETALRDLLNAEGYLCIRSAASKLVDLVCVDPRGLVWLLEVKATTDKAVYMSRTAYQREQHEGMKQKMYDYGSLEIRFRYVVRFADGHFEVFSPLDEIMHEGEGKPIFEVLPLRSSPNKPPIVPQTYAPSLPTGFEPMNSTSDVRANGNGGEAETADPDNAALPEPRDYAPASIAGLDHIAPDGVPRDAQC